ncbi:MAG: Sjogren's syndrome/scleroderma autoantigen 1 family protein [Nitrososphaeraceae archaeon]
MDSSRSSDVGTEGKSDMKDAVSFLLRGGSLLSAPCAICNGVQIKYKNEIICINCRKQKSADEIAAKASSEQQVSKVEDHFHDNPSFSAHTFVTEIEERIAEQFKLMKSEPSDLNNERQRIELIGMYFDLLNRLKNYPKKIQKQR